MSERRNLTHLHLFNLLLGAHSSAFEPHLQFLNFAFRICVAKGGWPEIMARISFKRLDVQTIPSIILMKRVMSIFHLQHK
jgi:hypothetical protein